MKIKSSAKKHTELRRVRPSVFPHLLFSSNVKSKSKYFGNGDLKPLDSVKEIKCERF